MKTYPCLGRSKESTNLDALLQWQLTVPYRRDLGDLALFSAEL